MPAVFDSERSSREDWRRNPIRRQQTIEGVREQNLAGCLRTVQDRMRIVESSRRKRLRRVWPDRGALMNCSLFTLCLVTS